MQGQIQCARKEFKLVHLSPIRKFCNAGLVESNATARWKGELSPRPWTLKKTVAGQNIIELWRQQSVAQCGSREECTAETITRMKRYKALSFDRFLTIKSDADMPLQEDSRLQLSYSVFPRSRSSFRNSLPPFLVIIVTSGITPTLIESENEEKDTFTLTAT